MRSSTGRWVSGQDFFDRERELIVLETRIRDRVTVEDVGEIYRTGLLGPSGQTDLAHYETRLKEGLEDASYTIAMEILAEAATRDLFTAGARRSLERLYSLVLDDAPANIADALEVLVHDGYLEGSEGGYRFSSRLLRDWWSARFRDHHVALEVRTAHDGGGAQVQ